MAGFNNIVPSSNPRFVVLPEGGPFDIYVQGVFTEDFEGLMSFSLGDTSSKITGLIKLSQQYLITLLTTPGSDMYEPNKGTELANLIGGNFYDKQELEIIIRDSVRSAARQVINQQAVNRPTLPDEVLSSAELSSLIIQEDAAIPFVLLRSEAGRFANVSLPNINVFS